MLPPPPACKLTPSEAAAVAKRGRKLLRAGRITHRQLALLDCLLWSCRNPITGAIVVSYSALQRLCHVARSTIAEALHVLERLGVLTRIKRRVRLAWLPGVPARGFGARRGGALLATAGRRRARGCGSGDQGPP